MSHAQRIYEYGGPEVMQWEVIDDTTDGVGGNEAPGAGEVRLKHDAIGVNFIDVYMRTGLYPASSMPFIPGIEGVGTVTEIGTGVEDLMIGDRVAYAGPIGAYAETRNIIAERCVLIPDEISSEIAASSFVQGMTARFLLKETYPVGPDTVILLHASAGGAGRLIAQWAAHLGATVIGTAGSDEKCELAKANGVEHAINYQKDNFVASVADITEGEGVDVVYDPIGKDTYPGSLDCLRPRGLWVPFGQASGVIDPIDIRILSQKKSLYATRPMLFDYIDSRDDLLRNSGDLFYMLKKGHLNAAPSHTYALKDASEAHRDLEARKTTGSIILLP